VLLVVCADKRDDQSLVVRPAPLTLQPLASRASELPRIIDESRSDALAELGALAIRFTDADHAWVQEQAATSLAELDNTTPRLAAICASRNLSRAAESLGMAPVPVVDSGSGGEVEEHAGAYSAKVGGVA